MEAKHILLLVTLLLVISALFVHRLYEGQTHETKAPVLPLNQNAETLQSFAESALTSL